VVNRLLQTLLIPPKLTSLMMVRR